jgi:hypothetical protein
MSTTTNAPINFATREINIYLGIPFFIVGVIGGTLNIIVFLSLKTFRQNSCAFFLTVMSFVNIGQLVFSLLSRVMISGFGIDWTQSSLAFCKFRNYCLQLCALMSYTCMCLATIDQFLATSLSRRLQQLFNIKRAYGLCLSFSILWFLHGIPSLIWYNIISPTPGEPTCTITNSIFQKYNAYGYIVTLTGVLPICITVLFGSFAYWHVRQIPYRVVPLVRRELDKQLTSMVLVQVAFNVFVIVPYIILVILNFTVSFSNQSIDLSVLNLISPIFGMIYYLYFAVSF